MVGILFDSIKPWLKPIQGASMGLGVAAALLLTSGYWRAVSLQLGSPWGQWAHALPALFIGIFFYYSKFLKLRLTVLGVCVLLVASAFSPKSATIATTYIAGILLMAIIAIGLPNKFFPFNFSRISSCAFGVYLSHSFSGKVIELTTGADGPLLACLTFALSIFLVLVLKFFTPSLSKYWL
jgi:hypothetical protein